MPPSPQHYATFLISRAMPMMTISASGIDDRGAMSAQSNDKKADITHARSHAGEEATALLLYARRRHFRLLFSPHTTAFTKKPISSRRLIRPILRASLYIQAEAIIEMRSTRGRRKRYTYFAPRVLTRFRHAHRSLFVLPKH